MSDSSPDRRSISDMAQSANNDGPAWTSSIHDASSVDASSSPEGIHKSQTAVDADVNAIKNVAGASHAEQAPKPQLTKLDVQYERTAFAIAHSVGIDGALNPLLADGASPNSKLPEGGEPVMRKEESESMGKRLVDEAREIGGVVKEAIEKVVRGRRSLSGDSSEKGSDGSNPEDSHGKE